MNIIENVVSLEDKITFIVNKIISDNDIPSDSFKAEHLKKDFEKSDKEFVDIVYALIKKTNLKINKSKCSHIDLAHRNSESSNYYNFDNNEVFWDFYNIKSLRHEIAHALDSNFKLMTHSLVINEFDKTFIEILFDELKTNYKSALNNLLEELRPCFDNKFPKSRFDEIKPLIYKHSKLYTYDELRKLNKDSKLTNKEYWVRELLIYRELWDSHYVYDLIEALEDVIIHPIFSKPFFTKHYILVDLLSIRFNFKCLSNAYGHGPIYYQERPFLLGEELFAELYAYYNPSTDEIEYNDSLFYKYFPNTVKAFKSLYKMAISCLDYLKPSKENPVSAFHEFSFYESLIVDLDKAFYADVYDSTKSEELKYPPYIINTDDSLERYKLKLLYLKSIEKNTLNYPDYKEGMMIAFRNKKDRHVLALSKQEQEVLQRQLDYFLYHRNRLFKFMFGERFKYHPYIDYSKVKTKVPSYVALYILNKQLEGRLTEYVRKELDYEVSRNRLSEEISRNIINSLVF